MKKRIFAGLMFALLFVPVLLISCPVEDPEEKKEENSYVPVAIGNYSGTGVGTGEGFAKSEDYLEEHPVNGKDITVTVTMKEGWIETLDIDGPDETAHVGGALITRLKTEIKKYNTFGVDRIQIKGLPDAIASASKTFKGVKEAGEKAIEDIKAQAGE